MIPPMAARGNLDRDQIRSLHAQELERFRAERPRSIAALERARAHMPNGVPSSWMASDNDQPIYIDHGSGPGFTDLDGFYYVDFNASDMAMFCGHANPAIVRAVSEQAARSTQFLLPTEASIEVAEELARRYPVSHWQFTLAATQANTEAIRVARAATGREVVLLFHGHYHGHFEEGLVDLDQGVVREIGRGLSRGVTGRVRIAEFNDAAMLEEALAPGDVALVLTEPAMSNDLHMLLPHEGWHAGAARAHPRPRHPAGRRRDAHPRRRAWRGDRVVRARARHCLHRQGGGGGRAHGHVWRDRGAGG